VASLPLQGVRRQAANFGVVGLRVLTAALVLLAAVADATSSPQLAFYALLAAVPVVAACGLSVFDELLGDRGQVGATALAGCLALLSLEGLLAALGELRRRALPSSR